MSLFPETLRLDLGIYVERFVKWLTVNYGDVFEAISNGVLAFLLQIEKLLMWVPWWMVLGIVFIVGWRTKNTRSGFTFAVLLFLIGTFGYWKLMMMTLAIVLTSVVFSLLIGVPIGILMAYNVRVSVVIKPILDAMQTMPSFVYLIPAIMLFGMGKVPGVFATTIYAVPPVIRLTRLGIHRVPKEMVEAAHSYGSSFWQTLIKVELPQALPTIMTGINQTTMMALSMVVVTSMIGVKGLGDEVLIGINRLDIGRGFNSGISIVFMAIIIDRVSQGIASRFKYPE